MPKRLVRTTGFRELEAGLSQLASKLTRKNVGRRALKTAAEPIAASARRHAPDDPATPDIDLESSIKVSSRQKSGRQTRHVKESPTEVVMFVGPTREGYPQAIMQEFGTRHHAAQPYMRPAWDEEGGDTAVRRIGKALGEEIPKAVGRQNRKLARATKKG